MLGHKEKDTYVIILLWLVFGMIIGGTIYNVVKYCTSAEYIAEKYVKALVNKDYKEIYKLLEKTSIEAVDGEKALSDYYKKIYDVQNQLIGAKITSYYGQCYEVQYDYYGRQETGKIELVKKDDKWQVIFPFKSYKLEIFGPSECQVMLDGEVLACKEKSCYLKEDLLPGQYMLQVKLPLNGHKDYYKMINIPEETSLILPYETGAIKVVAAPGLAITLEKSHTVSTSKVTLFSEMLVGDYEVVVSDQRGNIEAQCKETTIQKGLQETTFDTYTLSSKGKTAKDAFFDSFYKAYEQGIKMHDSTTIEGFLKKQPDQRVEKAFNAWYIDKKDIGNVSFEVKYKTYYLDEAAKLHQIVTETAELENHETNEAGEAISRNYRVVVTWDTIVNILQDEWQIENRNVLESVVAIQDSEGRWVQY